MATLPAPKTVDYKELWTELREQFAKLPEDDLTSHGTIVYLMDQYEESAQIEAAREVRERLANL